jgi:hypothetical protein
MFLVAGSPFLEVFRISVHTQISKIGQKYLNNRNFQGIFELFWWLLRLDGVKLDPMGPRYLLRDACIAPYQPLNKSTELGSNGACKNRHFNRFETDLIIL